MTDRAVQTPKSTVLMGYPWSMRPSSFVTIGSHHIVVTEEMHRGRWHRMPGDALCKPRSKFRDLDTHEGEHRRKEGQKFDCLMCLGRRVRYAPDAAMTDRTLTVTLHLWWLWAYLAVGVILWLPLEYMARRSLANPRGDPFGRRLRRNMRRHPIELAVVVVAWPFAIWEIRRGINEH